MSGDISLTVGGNISIFEFAFSQVDYRIVFFAISDILMFDVAKVLLIQLDKLHLAGGSVRLFPTECNQNNSKPLRGFAASKLNLPTVQGGAHKPDLSGYQTGSRAGLTDLFSSFHVCACSVNICLNIFADV